MRFCVLGSGSKGNSTYIESGDTKILIDSGFSGKETERRLSSVGVTISELSAILVTHEHTDHIKGVPVLSRRFNIPVFATSATFTAASDVLQNLFAFHEIGPGEVFEFQDLEIHPFSVSHDAADPVGYIVKDSRFSLGYCTDTGVVSRLMRHRLSGCNGLIIESNHDPHMLKTGPYPPMLKQRVRSNVGHLTNAEAAALVKELIHDDLVQVVLAHISETNNTQQLVREAVAEVNLTADPERLSIKLAMQDVAGDLIDIGGSLS